MTMSVSASSLNPALTQTGDMTVSAAVSSDGASIDPSTSTTTGSMPDLSTSATSSSAGTTNLGENDFLTLLMAQFQNQDPTSPMDDSQMLAQLAQFQSLEANQNMLTGINNLDTDFKSTVTAQQSSVNAMNNASSVSLIGKQVTIKASNVDWEGSTVPITVNLGNNTAATVQILDTNGSVVKTLQATGSNAQTSTTVNWDGSTDAGGTAANGTYTVNIVGQDKDSSLYAFVQNVVSGVRFTDSGAMLEIGGQEYSESDVMNVAMDQGTSGFSDMSSSSVVDMLGKTVRVSQSNVSYTGASGEIDSFKVNASPNATVNVAITDSTGSVVEAFQETADANGVATVNWNGMTYNGNYATPGSYAITIDGHENDPSLYAYTQGIVNSISNLNGSVQVNVAGQNVSLANIVSISST